MKYFKEGETVDILDTSSPKLFRKAVIVKEKESFIYKVFMLDCDQTLDMPLNKIRKINDN